jgi:hypothetical protein
MKKKISNSKRRLLILIFVLIFHSYSAFGMSAKPIPALQQKILTIARAEIGKGETIADNQGEDIDRYFANSGYSGAWCGAFVSWVLKEAGVNEFGDCPSARQFYNIAKKNGWTVKEPRAGDLIVFWRNKKKSWQGHIGIIERVYLDEIDEIVTIVTIEGNKGSFPAKVKRVHRKIDSSTGVKCLLGYVRIPTR